MVVPFSRRMKPLLHLLTGCTAVGKTAAALRWAEANDAEIVSCDSQLFYRGMDLGTAKPSVAERARVPHHMIDVLGVTEPMDVARYTELARRTVNDLIARGRKVLVVGGSGFYLKSFLGPVADEVKVEPDLRAAVNAMGSEAALAELRRLNPAGLGTLDANNPRRVTRALERCRASGLTLAELAVRFAALPAPFADCEVRLTRLDRAPADLERRIGCRVQAMLAAGLVDEVQRLRAAGLAQNPSAARAIGYREVLEMLAGRSAPAALAGEIARNTRALVKKQRTWFRTQLPVHRVVLLGEGDRGDGLEDLFER